MSKKTKYTVLRVLSPQLRCYMFSKRSSSQTLADGSHKHPTRSRRKRRQNLIYVFFWGSLGAGLIVALLSKSMYAEKHSSQNATTTHHCHYKDATQAKKQELSATFQKKYQERCKDSARSSPHSKEGEGWYLPFSGWYGGMF
jgi:hypothetical protein